MSRSKYKCPLCGFEFDRPEEKCHACPMSKGCKVICCPRCGYGFPDESTLIGWLKRIFGRRRRTGNRENGGGAGKAPDQEGKRGEPGGDDHKEGAS